MTAERRYDGDEIDEILRRATATDRRPDPDLATSAGLTLHELQEVGREAGIAPDRIADAARSLDRAHRVDRLIGLPVSVGRTVPLPRALTDDEWEALIADLRATFGATGKVHRDGSLRGWTNGNLHFWVEPERDGHRLRMGTTKGTARQFGAVGLGTLAMSGVVGTVSILTGNAPMAGAGALAAMGLGTLVVALGGLPRWARVRLGQMDDIARRLVERMTPDPPDGR